MYVIKLCSICVANFRITFSVSSLYASRLELTKTGLAQYLEGREKVVATIIWNSFHKQAQRQTEAEIHSMCHHVIWLPCSTSNFASWFLAVASDTNSGSDTPLDTWLWTHRSCGLFIGTVFLSEKWKSLVVQSCLTLEPHGLLALLGSSVLGILQARILEWVAISSSKESSWDRDWTQFSCIAGRFFTV